MVSSLIDQTQELDHEEGLFFPPIIKSHQLNIMSVEPTWKLSIRALFDLLVCFVFYFVLVI